MDRLEDVVRMLISYYLCCCKGGKNRCPGVVGIRDRVYHSEIQSNHLFPKILDLVCELA